MAMSICAALVRRERSGEGELVDLGITDLLATWTAAGEARLSDGSRPGGMPGYGTFPTADGGHVALGVIAEDHFWAPLCEVLGLGEHASLSFLERAPRVHELNALVGEVNRGEVPLPLLDRDLRRGVGLVLLRPGGLGEGHGRAQEDAGEGWRDAAGRHRRVVYNLPMGGALHRYAAFTTTPAGGNPAGIWIGEALPADAEMQRIAADVGFPETAFIAPARAGSGLCLMAYETAAFAAFVTRCAAATAARRIAAARSLAQLTAAAALPATHLTPLTICRPTQVTADLALL